MKYDDHVPLRIAEMVYSAEVEAGYYEKVGKMVGGLASLGFFFFPIIRRLPATRRILLSTIPGALICYWGASTKEDLQWGKSNEGGRCYEEKDWEE